MTAPTPEPTPEFDEPSEDELYAAALDEASARLDMPHPLSESYIVAARAGVDAALAVSARYAAAHDAQVAAKALRAWALDFRDRYPEGVFPKPTSEQYARVHEHLKAEGSAIDNYSGDLMRRAAACALRAADEIESEAPHA